MLKQLFTTPDALTIAKKDLENAKRDLLSLHAVAEHAAKMVEFQEGLVNRLTKYVQGHETKTLTVN